MNWQIAETYMDRFLKKRKTTEDENAGPSREGNDALDDSPSREPDDVDDGTDDDLDDIPSHEPDDDRDDSPSHDSATNTWNSSQAQEEINWEEEIKFDPGKRRSIDEYPPNMKDMVRRKYLDNGPCQPRTYDFPTRKICGRDRRFNPDWFEQYGSWLEYSESTDKAYCFCCFLFRRRNKKEAGYAAFVSDGWRAWNKKYRLKEHVGDVNSVHNQAKRDAMLYCSKNNTSMLL